MVFRHASVRRLLFAALAPAAVLAAQRGGTAAALVNVATVAIVAALLLSGDRRRDVLRRSRLLLLAALGCAFVSGLMPVAYEQLAHHLPPRPWAGDAVALAYVPFTIAGMLLIPTGSRRAGHRARAVADGLIASSSLWYLLLAVGLHAPEAEPGFGWSTAVAFAYPIGDVFVVATGLTVLARCTPAAGRMVTWMVAGLSLVAANDIWGFVSGPSVHPEISAVSYEMGLLLLIAAAAAPAVRASTERQPARLSWASGAVPFLPLIASMGMTTRMIVHGRAMPASQVLPALAVAVALMLRQLAASRDKQRLVQELQQRESLLQSELRVDGLTGLANRLGATERMTAALASPSATPPTVALIDLNDFKLINDNHGHAVGDIVLRGVGERLARTVRAQDVVARLGGDEFAVVTTGLDETKREALVSRLLAAFEEPFDAAGQSFTVHASIGVVVAHPGDTPSELLAHADAAMYQAKDDKQPLSAAIVLDAASRAEVVRGLRIREDIADPQLDQFHLRYQPIVDLATGRIRGFEALLRWQHPVLGAIPPDQFIPLAEQAGTIIYLGELVLTTALNDLSRLGPLHGDEPLVVGVNVSPRQLAIPGFVDLVLEAVRANNLSPTQLVVEITEQAFETNLDAVAAAVERLSDAGVNVAVDDFGTGYASLRYLQRLRLGSLKIDRSFVADVAVCTTSRQLVGSLSAMAAGLGLGVVAEGIETLDQLRLLQKINIELGQGYLFSQPVTVEEVERLVRSGHTYQVGTGDAVPVMAMPQQSANRVQLG